MGILEEILVELREIRNILASDEITPAKPNGGGLTALEQPTQPLQVNPAHFDPFAAHTPPVAAPTVDLPQAPVLGEADIMNLINPYLSQDQVKAGFSEVLGQMGIPRLPEARPEQYAELHRRFSAVIAQHAGGSTSIM
jgi:hypothetical protein